MQISCPVCHAPLLQQGKNLRCENNHSFDAARQGYWNLLLANKKRSKDPGDNPDMVAARRQFLDLGHYQALSDQVNQLALTALNQKSPANILDMGCGEGYYTDRLYQHLFAEEISAEIVGIDISKYAVKAACGRNKQVTWLVASGANPPVPEQSLDLQLVLFCRLMPEALAASMKTGAQLLIAWPGQDHLIELRKLIYKEIRESHFDPIEELQPKFELKQQQKVHYPFQLNSAEQIGHLLAMTPHSQRLKPEAQQQICEQQQLNLTLDVNLALLQKL